MSSPAPHPAAVQVLAFLPRDSVTDVIRRLLQEEGLSVSLRAGAFDAASLAQAPPARAWILDESVPPAAVAEALRDGHIPATAPVFVLARRLPDRDQYLAWLEAGAWDILKVPLEGVALALRLRNILGGGGAEQKAAASAARYSWASLVQVADETLALAHRYQRPLHCVSVAVDHPPVSASGTEPFVRRLAGAVQRLTRRSDLIGIADDRTLVVLLPDTDVPGAAIFVQRLQEALQDRIREWGIQAAVQAALVSAAAVESGHELLDLAEQKLRLTPR